MFTNYLVEYLWLGNNKLSVDIVDSLLESLINGLSDTIEARLENNLFTGDLSRIANLSQTQASFVDFLVSDLSNNHLQWSVSEAVPYPIQATLDVLTSSGSGQRELRVGGNNFSGTSLPSACFVDSYSSYDFFVLDLSNSQLEGEIFGSAFDNTCLPNIKLLKLSNNHANGSLPGSVLTHRPLSPNFVVDVSNNNLSGLLPDIPQSSNLYNQKYFAGNAGLCGGPLPPYLLALPQKQGTGVQWWVLVVAIGGSLIVAMGSCLALTWRWRTYHKKHQQDADLIRTLLERESATLMPLWELKKATDNF